MGKLITATTVKGTSHFLFRQLQGQESLGSLFEYTVDLVAENPREDLEALLGSPLTVTVNAESAKRHINGIITDAQFIGRESETSAYYIYRFSVRPWLWYLTQTSDCRIFQDQSAMAIIRQVLAKYPFDVEYKLLESYRNWQYCVQFRESDFQFISRLMQMEGIYYWFRHEDGKHTLVLADDAAVHEPVAGASEIPYVSPDRLAIADFAHIKEWNPSREIKPSAYATVDFDFNKPQASLDVRRKGPSPVARDLEIYEPIGGYAELEDGEHYARVGLQAQAAQKVRIQGRADQPLLATGATFKLKDHPEQAQNQAYLLVQTRYLLKEAPGTSSGGAPVWEHTIQVDFTAMPAAVQYRCLRTTPVPRAAGPQTAIVTGPAGEKIWTDQYGRIKVQFHWDREGQRNEQSSCWVRVSSPWAGGGFGGVQIPRVNDEVVINFVGGFLDRPIAVGRVYNASNMPAINLPDDATQSGVKTRSKDGGPDNANHMLFEDRPGQEKLSFGAEKDMDTHVKNNENLSVCAAQTGSHGGTTDMSVGGTDDNIFKGDSVETNGADHIRTITGLSNEIVNGPRKHRVGGSATTTMGRGLVRSVNGGLATLNYNAGRSRCVDTDYSHTAISHVKRTVNGSETSNVATGYFKEAKGGHLSMKAGAVGMTANGGNAQLNAKTEIRIEAGGNQSLSNPATLDHTCLNHTEKHNFSFKAKLMNNSTANIATSNGILNISLYGLSSTMASTTMRMSAIGVVGSPMHEDTDALRVEISGFKFKKYGVGNEPYAAHILLAGLINRLL
ncbi:type VI secretion system Vgr family protein [Advenella mimigardefordensis]|uniref:Putative type VI secretion system Rhs element Vgr protein n=1 Tax=Advenella mimigardefordensis (strain DSM 17166 / LMG 22922 / DPN7) TaxID=1247726 RepID=W0PIB1_ADVMD|nr:type VI secretion system tip protein TssI/VgrG [Advenella mimigardefordensis]AHG65572.1 putative type VI secretion system Rhs element Vgr protein [Advenella mimigardefordensis DPN7]